MKASGVPVVPGYEGEIRDEAHALEIAKGIGYPIMIKASAGGGGKGIRVAHNDEEFLMGFKTAKTEAKACFGDDSLYIENLFKNQSILNFKY